MQRFAGIIAMTALASPVMAEDIDPAFPVSTGCIDNAVGSAECPLDQLIDGLSMVSPGYFNVYRAAKMESFYMQYVTGAMTAALESIRDGVPCDAYEAAYFYGDTSFIYLTDDIPVEVADIYPEWQSVINNVATYIETSTGGTC